MKYSFVKVGTEVSSRENTLYLDVGNRLCFGIIDHHQLKNIKKSATHLVFENPDFIPKDLENIILHNSPDLDCIASSYLANYYFQFKKFPSFAKELCDFLDKSDFGLNLKNKINLSSLFTILKSKAKNDFEIVTLGHKLIEDLSENGFDAEFPPNNYQEYTNEIENDINIFSKDLLNSKMIVSKLFNRYTKNYEEVEGLILNNPKSKLFKYWARDKGYDLLIVQWNKRIVISLKGDSFYTLEGLENKLNKLETKRREELNICINEENREGYDIPDPWYDGRAHEYTIIDSPRRGTELNIEDILDVLEIKK